MIIGLSQSYEIRYWKFELYLFTIKLKKVELQNKIKKLKAKFLQKIQLQIKKKKWIYKSNRGLLGHREGGDEIPDSWYISDYDGFNTSSIHPEYRLRFPRRSSRWSDVCNYPTTVLENVQSCINTFYTKHGATRSLNVGGKCMTRLNSNYPFAMILFIRLGTSTWCND